jgi:iron complex outermembrane recepter protein
MTSTRILALAGVSLLPVFTPALAQTQAPPNDTVDPAQIVVEARRRSENLQDVPLVVNAVTADTLQKNNIRDFQDITSVVPGLSMTVNANGIGSSSSMRGVNHDVNVSGESGTIQYYFNDAPIASNLVLEAMFDISQIEVERGPQGTLRGRTTPSGSITIAPTKPDLNQVGAYIDGTAGSAATANINAGLNLPIIRDILAVRIAGLHDFNRGDRVYSVNNATPPRNETDAIRATVRFEPADWLKVRVLYQGMQHSNTGYDQDVSYDEFSSAAAPSASAPDYGTYSLRDRKSVENTPRNNDQRFEYLNWNVATMLADQKLIYVGSRTITNITSITPEDIGDQYPGLRIVQTAHMRSVGSSHEVRLQNNARVFSLFDYVVGFFQQKSNVVTDLTNPTPVGLYTTTDITVAPGVTVPYSVLLPAAYAPGGANPFVVNTPIEDAPSDTLEQSFFGNATLHIGDKTELAAGLRRIHFKDAGSALIVSGVVAAPAYPQDNNTTIYNVTLRHRFNDGLMVYASTGSSWRPAVTQVVGDFSLDQSSVERAHLASPPETSKSYEIGFKSEWMDRKILADVTYYHQNFDNYPLRAETGVYYIDYAYVDGSVNPTVGQFNFISPVGVSVNGVEAQLGFRPTRRFSIDSSINWSSSRVTHGALACDTFPITVVPTLAQLQAALGSQHLGECPNNGISATFQPEWSGSVQAEYDQPIGDHRQGFLRGLLSWRGASQNDPLNPYDNVGAYGLLNLYAGLRDTQRGWTLTFYAKNIANLVKLQTLNATPAAISQTDVNTSATAAANFAASTLYTSPYDVATVTPPREFGINLRIAFGSR